MDIIIEILGDNLSTNEINLLERSFLLLISLPVVTTLVGIFRHIIGLKSLSIYAPIILTFAFYELGEFDVINETGIIIQETSYVRGLQFGLVMFATVFFSSILFYSFLRQVRMHYIPKTTMVLISVVLSIMILTVWATFVFQKTGLLYLNSFSIIMIATLSENIISTQSRKKLKYTFIVSIQTLLISLIAYTIISLDASKEFLLNNFVIIGILLLLLNLYIGKFIGLRLSEYWRFRDLLLEDNSTVKKNVSKSIKTKKK